MSATRKLFIAAILLVAGFGVARLMGSPTVPWSSAKPIDAAPAIQTARASSPPATTVAPPPFAANGARLIPDAQTTNPYQVHPEIAASREPLGLPAESNVNVTPVPASPLGATNQFQLAVPTEAPHPAIQPRATLRNEAPRPLDIDSRAPAIVYSQPAQLAVPSTADAEHVVHDRSASADWRSSGLSPAGYVQEPVNIATITASYNQPEDLSNRSLSVAPPPWPEAPEEGGPRTHIVVDGDSLERLAGRYLDDPNRGKEIFEANRGLLATPDLLPIGAQLIIPNRARQSAYDGASPQSSLANDHALRAASNRGMVPVRPIPSAADVMPRAQLLPPVAAD